MSLSCICFLLPSRSSLSFSLPLLPSLSSPLSLSVPYFFPFGIYISAVGRVILGVSRPGPSVVQCCLAALVVSYGVSWQNSGHGEATVSSGSTPGCQWKSANHRARQGAQSERPSGGSTDRATRWQHLRLLRGGVDGLEPGWEWAVVFVPNGSQSSPPTRQTRH